MGRGLRLGPAVLCASAGCLKSSYGYDVGRNRWPMRSAAGLKALLCSGLVHAVLASRSFAERDSASKEALSSTCNLALVKTLASQQGSQGRPVPRGAEPSERWSRRIQRCPQPSPARLRSRQTRRGLAHSPESLAREAALLGRGETPLLQRTIAQSRHVRAKASKTRQSSQIELLANRCAITN